MQVSNLFNFLDADVANSMRWLRGVNLLAVLTSLLALASAWMHFKRARGQVDGRSGGEPWASRAMWASLSAAVVVMAISIQNRWVEVNHFPSQTMSEVLVMFSGALLLSMWVLHLALGLRRNHGYGWATVGDALVLVVCLGSLATNAYSSSLTTAQRDLPPALQSYWFAPHLSALIFSYATMGIAAAIGVVYFAARFWNQVLTGSRPRLWLGLGLVLLAAVLPLTPRWFGPSLNADLGQGHLLAWGWLALGVVAIAALLRFALGRKDLAGAALLFGVLTLLPFGQFLTWPLLVIVGLVFCGLAAAKSLPSEAAVQSLERTMDAVSFRAFAVGFPFLTGGLFMGAFWAQDAWANYWGWDSKENTALISWLVYVVYIHLRMLGGYRGGKAMGVLVAGALSIFMTFQIFGYLPDSQKSMHRYTDDGVTPQEGMQGGKPEAQGQAALAGEERSPAAF
jgi:ABC-type transport system involved in cytochrome c biogenesis permease subunit